MADYDQAQPQFQQRSGGRVPDRAVLRVHEWRGNRYVESIVQYSGGRFHLYEVPPGGGLSEPRTSFNKTVAQRITLYDFHETQDRKPPLLVLDTRYLNFLKFSENDTVLRAQVETFCFFGVQRPDAVLVDLELKVLGGQVFLSNLEVSDIESADQSAKGGIAGPVVLTAASLDSANDLVILLTYQSHFTGHFLNKRIGLDLDAVDNDVSVNRGKWQLRISFPQLGSYLPPESRKVLPADRNFRTIRFDLTTHKFGSQSGGNIRLAGFLTHQDDCRAAPPQSADRSIPIKPQQGLRHRDFPDSFTITQRAPARTGAAPIPPAPGGDFLVSHYVLHLEGVPGFVVPDQWNALLPDYFHALQEVQGGRPISFAPKFVSLKAETGHGFWILTYHIEDRWTKTDTTDRDTVVYALSLHQQPSPTLAPFKATLDSVKALDQSSIGLLLLRLQSDPNNAAPLERLETEPGIVLETPFAIGLDPAKAAVADGPLDSNTVRMGSLDLEFSNATNLQSTAQAINKLQVRPEPCRVSVHIQAEFALKRVLPGGQDDPDDEVYVPENQLNAAFMSACLTSQDTPLLFGEQQELSIEAGFQRKRPLVIVSDRQKQPSGTFVLSVTEDVRADKNQTVALKVLAVGTPPQPILGIDPTKPCDALSSDGFVDVIVLDSDPFLAARVRAQPFTSPDLFKGSAIASWTNAGVVNWQIKAGNNPFCLVLPPQGVGEEMEKERTISDNALAKYNLTPPGRLQLNANLVDANFTEAPWNLRRLLGVSGEPNTGPVLTSVQVEMLYGMFCTVAPQALQLADVFSLVGHIPPRRNPDMRWKSADANKQAYTLSRVDWSNTYRRYLSRVALLQPWQSLQSQTPVLKEGLVCTLRTSATTNPFQANAPGLKGGALWGVESLNIYSVLASSRSDSAEIADPAFSALGGWGHQKANFQGGLSVINADVAMGRTYRYKIERIGRIGVWWNLAKHVIVYERTVAPSRQFFPDQSHLLGRPVLRKIREYVEIIEDTRAFPDTVPGSSSTITKNDPDAPKRRRGFVAYVSFPKGAQYNVRGSWGGDVSAGAANAQTLGWKVPLWHAGAYPADVYPKPKVAVGMHSHAANDPVIVAGEIDDPENLCFFTITNVPVGKVDPDPHAWDPFPDVDYSVVPMPAPSDTDFTAGNLQHVTPDEPPVPVGHGPCTFRLAPQPLPVNLGQERSQQPLSAVLRNVTMTRAALKDVISPAVKDIAGLPGQANAAVAAVFAKLPPIVDPNASLPAAVKQDIASAIQQKIRDPLAAVQANLKNQLFGSPETLSKNLDALEKQRFDQLTAAVEQVRLTVEKDIASQLDDINAKVMSLDQWEKHFREQILRKVEEAILQLETAAGSVQHLLLKYAETASAWIDGVQQRIVALQNAISSGSATLAIDAIEAVRQIRDIEARLRAAGQQRPLNWLPDPTEYIVSQLGLADLDKTLADIESAAIKGNTQVQAVIQALKADEWAAARYKDLGQTLVFKFLANSGEYTRAAIQGVLETEGHRFEKWRDQILDQSAALKALSDDLTAALPHSGDVHTIETQVNAALDKYFTQTVAPALGQLKTALDTQKAAAFKFLKDNFDKATDGVNRYADQLAAALEGKAGEIAEAVLTAGPGLAQNTAEYCEKHFRSLLPPGFAPSPDQILNAADKTIQLARAFGDPPTVPNLDFGRGALGYYFKEGFDDVDRRIGITPVLANVNKAAKIAGAAQDLLQSVGVTLPTTQILDSLIPASLKNFDLSSILPDFAGLKLANLFSGLKMPDINENQVKITHDIDPQSRRAVVRADINFPIDTSSTVFSIGPLSLDLLSAQFTAAVTIDAQGSTVRRSVNADINGKWQLGIGGMAMVKFNGTHLRFDDSGTVRFEISPAQVELPGIMSFINELLTPTGGGADGLTMGPVDGGYQCVLSLPVPDMQGATTGISNLTLGARLALMYAPKFQFQLGFFLARKEAPFSLTAFILGGGGYLNCNATYTPDTHELMCSVDLAITASASLAIALGPIKGGVYVYLGITATFESGGANAGLSVGAMLLIRGNVDLAGIITASLSLLLEARYEHSRFKARGELSISIKICWCFTLSIHESVEYSVAAPGSNSGSLRRHGPLLASLDPMLEPLEPPPFAGSLQYATEYTNMLT